ncbi:MAG: hypothetical protein R6V02_04450 [Candidatus Aminicenantes bacterium]
MLFKFYNLPQPRHNRRGPKLSGVMERIPLQNRKKETPNFPSNAPPIPPKEINPVFKKSSRAKTFPKPQD